MTTSAELGWTPLVLAVAPNGARKTRQDHPALPITPAEIADTAAAALEAGAAMIHLHVRDAEEKHSLDAGAYREAIAAVRARVGDAMVIQVTSEAVGIYNAQQQMAMVRDLVPEAVSLAIREIVPDAESEPEARRFLGWLSEAGILPQYILYDAADVTRLAALMAAGVVPEEAAFLLFVLGRYSAGQRSQPTDLLPFLSARTVVPVLTGLPWAVCAFGPQETACAAAAAALGGHARVGFENNLFLPSGAQAGDNAELVAAAAAAARTIGRPLADAATARLMMKGGQTLGSTTP
ncbi:3-keto-5-aminohexanoate cleavage protein [Pelagibius litoralis]|uniref:3-keto-5-aminohexanoate cleavage protein n=1 Tax=Pelagibius litoralis TaxID=374515 RepID=A0A967EZA7_9PROT|nr:3-keto-5-aminohexanoate cleavage protein [Pelagibius litoralis]NIA70196.1 3-keto-5-aminohexanoate cleavage protein [Pelagibius litoralis]